MLQIGLLFALTAGAPPAEAGKGKAKDLYRKARQAELQKDYDQALVLYEQAQSEYPEDHRYELAVRRMTFVAGQAHVDAGRRLRDQGLYEEALEEFEKAIAIDPASTVAEQQRRRTLDLIEKRRKLQSGKTDEPVEEPRDITASALDLDRQQREEMVESLKEPPRLEPLSSQPINITMSEQAMKVFETIGKLAGLNVLFDPDYQDKRVDIAIQNATLYEALDYVALRTKSFWKPISGNAIFITNDNANKRREYEEEIVKTIYLNNVATPQELQEITTAIRGLTDIRRMFPVTSMNALILRGSEAKLALAEKVVLDIDKARPEVIVDVLVLEASRSRTRDLGISPTGAGGNGINIPFIFNRNRSVDGDGDVTDGTIRLGDLGRVSSNDWVTTLPNAQLTALFTSSDTNLLQSPRIRVSDNQQASLRIGERVPIATGSFQPGVGGVGINPLVNTQFQYVDVGVNVDLQPRIHNDREVSLHVEIEISNVSRTAEIGGIDQPIFGQRTISHDIRIEEGEASILGGLNQSQVFKTRSGVPFLADIPILGRLFSITSVNRDENEILVVLIPHIVRLPTIEDTNLKSIASGSDQTFEVRYKNQGNGQPALPPIGAAQAAEEQAAAAQPPAAAPASPAPEPQAPAATAPAAQQPPPGQPPQPDAQPTQGVDPAIPARITFNPVQPAVAAGEQFTVDVMVNNAQQLFGAPLRIGFDKNLLQLVEVTKGDFLAGEEATDLIFSRNIRNQVGQAAVNISRFPGTGGASGSGVLVRLTFQALAPGQSALRIIPAGARNAQSQPVNMPAASVNVRVQ